MRIGCLLSKTCPASHKECELAHRRRPAGHRRHLRFAAQCPRRRAPGGRASAPHRRTRSHARPCGPRAATCRSRASARAVRPSTGARIGQFADPVEHDADAAHADVSPSGRPSTARTWFSNWLRAAPSMVQCPELCTRGAISLPSSLAVARRTAPARTRRRSRAARRCARVRATRPAATAANPARARGSTERMPSACQFWYKRPGAEFAIAATHGDDRQLALERHEGLQDRAGRRLRASACPGGIEIVAASRRRNWPLPS